jgi:CRISPR-associated protein Cas1
MRQFQIRRELRKNPNEIIQTSIDTLDNSLTQLETATDLDQLRGFKGNGAKVYFNALSEIVGSDWNFNQRVRQPPTDGINAMLFSHRYTQNFWESSLRQGLPQSRVQGCTRLLK